MNHCRRGQLLTRSSILMLAAFWVFGRIAWGAGSVTEPTQANLEAALAGGGAVTFACAGTITLTNTIVIAQDTSLDANSFAVTISGGNAVRLFQVESNMAFSLKGLNLASGRVVALNGTNGSPPVPGCSAYGAGILNLGGTVTLTDCTLANHWAQGGDGGGGPLDNGMSTNTAGGDGFGAALCSLGGALNLTNCVLRANSAQGGGSLPLHSTVAPGWMPTGGRGMGAAIYSADGQVRLEGVTLAFNSATGGPQGTTPAAITGTAGEGLGGALYVTNSDLVLSDCTLDSNSANGGCSDGLGGALFLDQDSSGLIRLCRFLGNAANGVARAYHSYFPGGNGSGGAVFNAGELQISSCTFSSNSCAGGFGFPGGIAGGGALCSTNLLSINRCTFDANLVVGGLGFAGLVGWPGGAGEGGAIWSSGELAATNSTWASNQASGGASPVSVESPPPPGAAGSGGAVCFAGGQAVLVNVTIASNAAYAGLVLNGWGQPTPPGPSQGGGLYVTNGALVVRNSIIANSTSGGDVCGALTDGGYNICSDGTAGFAAASSLNQTNPLLGPLADNGGPTHTMALLSGSPALDAIPSGFPPIDQCGTSRPQGPLADIGAFEAPAPAGPTHSTLTITLLPSNSVAIRVAGASGATYNTEASTDLVHWTQVFVGSAGADGSFEFVDTNTDLSQARYYRARVP